MPVWPAPDTSDCPESWCRCQLVPVAGPEGQLVPDAGPEGQLVPVETASSTAAGGRRGRFADRRSNNFDYQPLAELESQITSSPAAAPPRRSGRRGQEPEPEPGTEPELVAVSIRGNFSGRGGFAHSRLEKRKLAAQPSLAVQERKEFTHQLERHDPEVILQERVSIGAGEPRAGRGGGTSRFMALCTLQTGVHGLLYPDRIYTTYIICTVDSV